MLPFGYVVFQLVIGLREATSKHPGETQDGLVVRWFGELLAARGFGESVAMLPFCYVGFQLVIGVSDATCKHTGEIQDGSCDGSGSS